MSITDFRCSEVESPAQARLPQIKADVLGCDLDSRSRVHDSPRLWEEAEAVGRKCSPQEIKCYLL